MLSDHSGIKLEIKKIKENLKKPHICKLGNIFLLNPEVKIEILKEIKEY